MCFFSVFLWFCSVCRPPSFKYATNSEFWRRVCMHCYNRWFDLFTKCREGAFCCCCCCCCCFLYASIYMCVYIIWYSGRIIHSHEIRCILNVWPIAMALHVSFDSVDLWISTCDLCQNNVFQITRSIDGYCKSHNFQCENNISFNWT